MRDVFFWCDLWFSPMSLIWPPNNYSKSWLTAPPLMIQTHYKMLDNVKQCTVQSWMQNAAVLRQQYVNWREEIVKSLEVFVKTSRPTEFEGFLPPLLSMLRVVVSLNPAKHSWAWNWIGSEGILSGRIDGPIGCRKRYRRLPQTPLVPCILSWPGPSHLQRSLWSVAH